MLATSKLTLRSHKFSGNHGLTHVGGRCRELEEGYIPGLQSKSATAIPLRLGVYYVFGTPPLALQGNHLSVPLQLSFLSLLLKARNRYQNPFPATGFY
jgi:hypothetical protein